MTRVKATIGFIEEIISISEILLSVRVALNINDMIYLYFMAFIFLAASKIECSTEHCKSNNSQGICCVDISFLGII